MKNLGAILTEAGSSWDKVVKTTILLVRAGNAGGHGSWLSGLRWLLLWRLLWLVCGASVCKRDPLESMPFPGPHMNHSICSCIRCPQVDMNDFAAVNAIYGKVRLLAWWPGV